MAYPSPTEPDRRHARFERGASARVRRRPGGSSGLLVKDYRGKDANQVVWKFDAALEARIADNLKQAAIEEGQWTEKREVQDAGAAERKARINRGRDRLAMRTGKSAARRARPAATRSR